jgi:hypothetical protein
MKILQSLRTNTSRKAAESVETTTSGSAAKKKVSIYWFTQQWPQVRLCLQQPNFMQKSDCQQEHCKSIARCIMFAKMTNYCQIDFQETSWQEHDKIHVCKQQISAKSFHSNHKDQMQEEQEDDCEKYYVLKLL